MAMQESIYNLVPEEHVPQPKPPMYRSKYDPKGALTGSTFGLKGTTRLAGAGAVTQTDSSLFGPKNVTKPDPHNFLRKGEKTSLKSSQLSTSNTFAYTGPRKPSVPDSHERPILGIRSNKNFITSNAVETILQAPRRHSEEEPNYLEKKDYGKVPAYLDHVKEEIQRENQIVEEYVRDQMGMSNREEEGLEELPNDERLQLIEQLKIKWDTINAQYQRMCHMVNLDTIGKIRRKEQMELELRQIEQDIERLEKSQQVLICR